MVTITLNGQAVEVAEGSTLLEAATAAGTVVRPPERAAGSCSLMHRSR